MMQKTKNHIFGYIYAEVQEPKRVRQNRGSTLLKVLALPLTDQMIECSGTNESEWD
jgi:hypothetical protein